MKPYIMRNGGWVTPQLDNIREKEILEQLLGKLVGHTNMRAHPITLYRLYITVGERMNTWYLYKMT